MSRDPAAETGPWHSTPLPGYGAFAVGCGSRRQCVAVTQQGDAFSTSDLEAGSWQSYRADGINPFTGVSCPQVAFCVATDNAGDVLASADPRAAASSWHGRRVDPGVELTGISCFGIKLCVAVDKAGAVVSSTDVHNRAGTWSRAEIDPGHALDAVDCPSLSLCAAIDDAGSVFTSTDPNGGATAWTGALIDPTNVASNPRRPSAVTCVSPSFCMVVDVGTRHVLTSTDPAGGESAWHSSASPGGYRAPVSASCPSVRLCVVTTSQFWSSTDPADGSPRWKLEANPNSEGWRAGICPSTSLCLISRRVLGGSVSQVYASTNPTGGDAAWHLIGADPDGQIVGFSCQPDTPHCLAVDDQGSVLISHKRG